MYMYSFRARGEDNIGLKRVYTQLKNQCDVFEKLLNTQKQKLESTMANESIVSDSFVGSSGMFSYITHHHITLHSTRSIHTSNHHQSIY